MRVYFVNRFYAPDISATAQLLTELTQRLASDFDISVVTSRFGMNGSGPWPAQETRLGVKVFRLRSTSFGKAHLWQKAIDLITFHVATACFLFRKVQAGDLVVLKTDPPLLQLLNTSLVHLNKGKVINWLQDIYPEIAIRAGKFPAPGVIRQWLLSWRDRALNRAKANIVISDAMAGYLHARGVHNLQVSPNWAISERIEPLEPDANPLRAEWGLQDQFVVMYSGNFGRVHAFAEIVEAVRELADTPSVTFLMVGGGPELKTVKAQLSRESRVNFVFKPAQTRELLGQSLGVANIHLVSLGPGMESFVMPSKIYGILATGRPIGFVGETGSCIARQLVSKGVGFAVQHGEGRKLAEEVKKLMSEPLRCAEMGRKAQDWFQSEFTLTQAVSRWRKALQQVQGTVEDAPVTNLSGESR